MPDKVVYRLGLVVERVHQGDPTRDDIIYILQNYRKAPIMAAVDVIIKMAVALWPKGRTLK